MAATKDFPDHPLTSVTCVTSVALVCDFILLEKLLSSVTHNVFTIQSCVSHFSISCFQFLVFFGTVLTNATVFGTDREQTTLQKESTENSPSLI